MEPQSQIPRQPFLLDSKRKSKPSLFEVDLLVSNDRYTYGFTIDSKRVLEEWLYAYPQGKKQSWFVRRSPGAHEYTFSRFLTGENKSIQALTRPNSLFLSAAAQNNHRMLIPIFEWFAKAMIFIDQEGRNDGGRAALTYRGSGTQDLILEMVKNSDLGVSGIDIEDKQTSHELKKAIEPLWVDDPEGMAALFVSLPSGTARSLRTSTYRFLSR